MQLGLNKHLQPHEIKSYKHKIKNQTNKNESSVPYTKCTCSQSIIQPLTNNSLPNVFGTKGFWLPCNRVDKALVGLRKAVDLGL